MFTDGPRAEPPARAEEKHLKNDDEDDDAHRDGPLAQEHLDDPAHEGQFDQALRHIELVQPAGARWGGA